MNDKLRMEYDDLRGTWKVIVNDELLFETYDQERAEEVFAAFFLPDYDEVCA